MRRALIALALAALAGSFVVSRAVSKAQTVDRIDGIGLIDYTTPPHWRVGDFVRYHVSGGSAMGSRDDYDLTLVLAGEEVFWGDSCFWLETWNDAPGVQPMTTTTLMSYSIFADSLAEQHMEAYRRKFIEGLDEEGHLVEKAYLLSASTARQRTMFATPIAQDVESLGVDTVRTPLGLLRASKVSIHKGIGAERSAGDSSSWNEERENRMRWYSPAVPITHIAYEEIEKLVTRRSWLIGRSRDAAATVIRDRGFSTARMTAAGHGLKGRGLPEARQKSFAQSAAAARPRATAAGARAPARR